MKRMVFAATAVLVMFSLFLGCAQEKKPDYNAEINAQGKIVAEADAKLAANKFDEAAADYQKAWADLDTLKQKIPAGDPSLTALETMIDGIKAKLEKVAAAKQEFAAKAAEAKKAEAKPEAKPKAKAEIKTKAKAEVKSEAQTKNEAAVAEPAKKEPVKWKVVYRGTLKTGEAEWHILCGENLARIVRQDPRKKEKAYQGGFGGKWYDKLDEAAVAACSK
jgi:hypothetical protein